jgi:BioD-like phosphotransacetylase family protein
MAVLLVASSEPRVGRSLIAAAIAYRAARDGRAVTLARLAGDESAQHDARAFAAIELLTAPGAPITSADVASLSGDIVLEAPAGSVKELAQQLGARILVVAAPASPPTDAPDDAIAGTIVTNAPAADIAAISARRTVLAVLPEDRTLAAPSVSDIAETLDARWLHEAADHASIDRVMIGTVASDAASPYFGNRERKCVITRFDKTDIQLAALLTDLACMVITGGGEPSPYLIDRIEGGREHVALLEASGTTVETMTAHEGLFGRSRFEGSGKLDRAVALLDEAVVPPLFSGDPLPTRSAPRRRRRR